MKISPATGGILYLLISFAVLFFYDRYHHDGLTVEKAMLPVQYLTNARHAIIKENYPLSINSLDKAIESMRVIETYADSSATSHIEVAIRELKNVEAEIKNDSLILMDLNKAYFDALNSIAYANLTISEKNIESGEKYRAISFMNATFVEMVKSLKFATDDRQKDKENEVIDKVKKILTELQKSEYQYDFDADSLNKNVRDLIEIE